MEKIKIKAFFIIFFFVLIFSLTFYQLNSSTDEYKTIIMKVYDKEGNKLSYEEFMDIVTNGNRGWAENDMLFNINDYTIVEGWVIYKDDEGNPCFDFKGSGIGLSLTWMTKNTGYFNLFLDNEGAGFSKSETIIFNYEAALSYWKKLNNALSIREDYNRSAEFNELYENAKYYINLAKQANKDSLKGKYGQIALDYIAQAYELLLYEYGIQYAQRHPSQQFWWGVTIDRIDDYENVLNSVSDLIENSATDGWIRIVFDEFISPDYYDGIVSYAQKKNLHIMGEILDSSCMRLYSLEDFKSRVREYVNHFPDIEAWEIGNEINGEWLGENVVAKIEYAADYIKKVRLDAIIVLTLYWQFGTEDIPHSVFQWIKNNLKPELINKIDVIALSIYVMNSPLGMAFDEVFQMLHKYFPEKKIMIGEMDYWYVEGEDIWWWHSNTEPVSTVRKKFCKQMYASALGYPFSLLGGFWWYYNLEMYPPNDLWRTLNELYKEVHRKKKGVSRR